MTAILLGFLLGMQHALDPDHLVAVSTIVSDQRDWKRASLFGALWGLGHTSTLLLFGLLVLVLHMTISPGLASGLELLVAVMLIGLGLYGLLRRHSEHEHHAPSLRRPFLVGLVHGAAGSAALMLLVLGTISSVLEGLLYIALFGVGSVFGMLLLSGVIGLPIAFTAKRSARIHDILQRSLGLFSIGFGIFLGYEILHG
jgi:hypothetical protein